MATFFVGAGLIASVISVESPQEVQSEVVLTLPRASRVLAISPDCDTVVTAVLSPQSSSIINHSVAFWNTKSWTRQKVIDCPTSVEAIAIAPDGNLLATGGFYLPQGSQAGATTVWNLMTGEALAPMQADPATCLDFSPDGELLATGNWGAVHVLPVRPSELAKGLYHERQYVMAVDYSPDGRLLAFGGGRDEVKLAVLDTRTSTERFARHPGGSILDLAFTPDGKILLVGGGMQDHPMLSAWNVATGVKVHSYVGHQHQINSLAVSADGSVFASASRDSTVKLWEVATGKALATFKGHAGDVHAVVYNKRTHTWITSGEDKTVREWSWKSEDSDVTR